MMRIPLAKPSFDDREVEAVRRVLESGWVVQGPEVEAFEATIAEMHEAKHCIAVTSGTAALHVCYLALGIGRGDAVFVPSFAWPSAANMAMMVGARPVFVDVLPGTYNIDPTDLRRQIDRCLEQGWGKPRAIVSVHEFGLAAAMTEVMAVADQYGLEVIEDAACALGATYKGKPVGTLGRMGIFSFHPRKSITTGEGGVIVTNEDELANWCRTWRNHGQTILDGKRDFLVPGLNYRMTEFQAAIGRVQCAKFPEILKKRRELATLYLRQLAGCSKIVLPSDCSQHTWQTFMIVLDDQLDREPVTSRLNTVGIGVGPGSVAGHSVAVYRKQFEYQENDLPQSAKLHRQGLALPLYSAMKDCDVDMCSSRLLEEIT